MGVTGKIEKKETAKFFCAFTWVFWGFAMHYFDACTNKKKSLTELPCKWEHHAIGMLQDTKMTDVKFLRSNTLYWGDAMDLNRHRIKKTKKLKLISKTGLF